MNLPSGLEDLLGDAAACTAARGQAHDVTVPGVGVVRALRLTPASAAVLAMTVYDEPVPAVDGLDAEEREAAVAKQQNEHVHLFVRQHLADGEWDRLLVDMLDPDRPLPADAIGRIARCIATSGTARTYTAVRSLTLMAARSWRAIRYSLQSDGLADPMTLPSLHIVLDRMEQLALDAFMTGDPKKADQERVKRDQWVAELYRADPPFDTAPAPVRSRRKRSAPAGFSATERAADWASLSKLGAR